MHTINNIPHVREAVEINVPDAGLAPQGIIDKIRDASTGLVEPTVTAYHETDCYGDSPDDSGVICVEGWRPATQDEIEESERRQAAVAEALRKREEADERARRNRAASDLRRIKRDFPDLLQ